MNGPRGRQSRFDFIAQDEGSLILLRPMNAAAKQWLIDNVGTPEDEVQWFGGALVVQPRYLNDLVDGAHADGLTTRRF